MNNYTDSKNNKNIRLRKIKQIIEENAVPNQEALSALLLKNKINVTQATLSRDLKTLKVSKIPSMNGGYSYSLPTEEMLKKFEQQYISDIQRAFLSIDFSYHLAVVKTTPGHASSVAFALDNLEFQEILGTIAGDDSILVVLKEGYPKESFLASLKNKIPNLEADL